MTDDQPAQPPQSPTTSPGPQDISKQEGSGHVTPPGVPPEAVQTMEVIQRTFQGALRIGPPEDPFIAKLTPQHISDVIANKERDSQRDHGLRKLLVFVIPIAILLLCLMFLAFKETQHLEAIISSIIAFGGGLGIGRAWKKE